MLLAILVAGIRIVMRYVLDGVNIVVAQSVGLLQLPMSYITTKLTSLIFTPQYVVPDSSQWLVGQGANPGWIWQV